MPEEALHDCKTRLPKFKVGDRVFVYMPKNLAKGYKFAISLHGPYHIASSYRIE